MRLLVTVADVGDRVLTAGPRTVVGDVIEELGGTKGQVIAVRRTGEVLDRDVVLSEADVRTGDIIDLRNRSSLVSSASGTAPATLMVVGGPARGTAFELTYGLTTIGRVSGNDVTIVDTGISRRHATIEVTTTEVTVTDNGSTNGLTVNGERVTEPTSLVPGDRLALGETVIIVEHRSNRSWAEELRRRGKARRRSLAGTADEVQSEGSEAPASAAKSSHSTDEHAAILGAMTTTVLPDGGKVDAAAAARSAEVAALADPKPEFHRRARSLNRYEGRVLNLPTPPAKPGRWTLSRAAVNQFELATTEFHQALSALSDEVAAEQAAEVTERLREAPDLEELTTIATVNGSRLWERTLGDFDALKVRIGLGDLPTRSRLVAPPQPDPELNPRIDEFLTDHRTVADVPVVVDVAGGLRLVGPHEPVSGLASSIVVQLAVLHAPTDLVLGAMVGPETVDEWDWLKWLPQVRDGRRRFGVDLLTSGHDRTIDLSRRLVEVVAQRSRRRERNDGERGDWPAVVMLIDERAKPPDEAINELVKNGPDNDVHLLWLAVDSPPLTQNLAHTVTVDASDHAASTMATVTEWRGDDEDPIQLEAQLEQCSDRRRLQIARRLAPIVDHSGRSQGDGLGHGGFDLATLYGSAANSPRRLVDRWTGDGSGLGAPVGRTGHGPIALNLVTDGPHAIVVGDEGSGKTSLLETWVASLAASHSPSRLEFHLVGAPNRSSRLLDACGSLPHVATNLSDPAKAGSTLSRLSQEAARRTEIVSLSGAASIDEIRARGRQDLPRSLVVVIDDLIDWADAEPGFVAGVVDLVDRARHLGVHLIASADGSRYRLLDLCPAPVERIRDDAGIRVALRLADAAVSEAVIGSDAALDIDRMTPGRAWVRSGEAAAVQFQTARACLPTVSDHTLVIRPFDFETTIDDESSSGSVRLAPSPLFSVIGEASRWDGDRGDETRHDWRSRNGQD